MKIKSIAGIVFSLLCVSCTSGVQQKVEADYASLVNPFIGTDFTGNTYPGAQAPFGMVQLSPDNGTGGWDRISGYFYPDSTIAGFSHTHLSGTGAGDLYDLLFMPVTLPYKECEKSELGIYSSFSHADEKASAGYYSVLLKDYDIQVELTATPRVGIQRYTFPKANSMVILNLKKAMNWDFTADSHIEFVDSCTIRGYRKSIGWANDQRVYFVSRFSRPFEKKEIVSVPILKDKKEIGKAEKGFFYFNTKNGDQITICTAISGVSMEGAERNLLAEAPLNDFDGYLKANQNVWNEELGRIQVKGDNTDDLVNFYTALYHSKLAPTIFSDVDGSYFGPDKQIHKTEGWTNYSTFSLWDTYRAAHPLFTYTDTERVNDMVKSFLAFYKQNGRLPVWNMWGNETDMMIGYHSVPVIVDAYLKGIGDFDADLALEACVKTANIDDYRDLGEYKKIGYVSTDSDDRKGGSGWSFSRSLEYAFDDFCIAEMAKKMGKNDIAEEFYNRSQNYRKLYNPETGFLQPRNADGSFLKNFNPDDYTKYICESNAWHYLWNVPQDIEGLMSLLGGKDKFTSRLDSMFTYVPKDKENLPLFSTGMIGQYVHGNEPCHHVAYLYNAVGEPAKTQKYVAEVMHTLYKNSPDGLCGNEDCGQMSAWYVLSAMGFYPVNPVSGIYEIGTPLFPEIRLSLSNGKVFTIIAENVSHENCYIQSVKVNGLAYDKSYITHQMIMDGATIEFVMGNLPGKTWY